MDFVSFEIAKKLKEKGFTCQYPIAMYNERGVFHALYSSVGLTECYDYDYFDEHDYICPTISRVLKWLREEKKLHIAVDIWGGTWGYDLIKLPYGHSLYWTAYREDIKSYEDAALDGIKYIIDVLI